MPHVAVLPRQVTAASSPGRMRSVQQRVLLQNFLTHQNGRCFTEFFEKNRQEMHRFYGIVLLLQYLLASCSWLKNFCNRTLDTLLGELISSDNRPYPEQTEENGEIPVEISELEHDHSAG